MIDPVPLDDAKRRFDFLRAVPDLHLHARTSGGEYHGPCPSCGGADRFVAWPRHPDGPRAWCRQCHPDVMDPVAFLAWRDGLSFPEACARLGVGLSTPMALPRAVATYDYLDEAGVLLYQVLRYAPKTFRQRRPDGLGGWIWKLGDVRRVLYGLPALGAAPESAVVWLVEGEKDADALIAAGEVATTNPGGAGSWRPAYAEALRDRLVVVVPDADAGGAQWQVAVGASLVGVARAVKVVALPDGHKDVSDFLAAGGTVETLAALAGAAPRLEAAPEGAAPVPPAPAPRFRVLGDAAIDALPPPNWLIDEVLIAGAVNVLYGPGGSGKSVLAIDAACTLAAGLPTWYGRATAPGPVVYIAAEAPEEVAQRRRAWKADRAIPDLPGFFLVPERVPLLDPGAVPALIAALPPAAARPALVVVDTLSRTMRGGDENSAQDMGRVFEAAEQLRDATGATVLIIHHSGKDTSRGARGASSLTYDARQALACTKSDNVITLETEKHNNSGEQAPFRFVFREVPDPAYPDHPTVVLGLAAPEVYGAASGPLAPTQRAVLEVLGDAIHVGEASSAELERVDELRGRGVHRALVALVTRGLVRTPSPPKTPGRRFFVTAAGWAALGRVPPSDGGPTRSYATLTAPDRRSDAGLTLPSDRGSDVNKSVITPGTDTSDAGLTPSDAGLTPLTGGTDGTDAPLKGRQSVSPVTGRQSDSARRPVTDPGGAENRVTPLDTLGTTGPDTARLSGYDPAAAPGPAGGISGTPSPLAPTPGGAVGSAADTSRGLRLGLPPASAVCTPLHTDDTRTRDGRRPPGGSPLPGDLSDTANIVSSAIPPITNVTANSVADTVSPVNGSPIWTDPPPDAPPAPRHLGHCGHSALAIAWDAGPPGRWRCRSCWTLHGT